MLPESTEVLIVGAGPAGLAAAISLYKSGVTDITIVDALPTGQNISRAVVIHAQTTEKLNELGCAEPLIERGIHAKYMKVNARKANLVNINFSGLKNTQFPYALLISQTETEEVLLEVLAKLGVKIIRPVRVSNIEPTPEGIKATFESGEVVKAKYVVGADGSRSTIRKLAGIAFKDPRTGEDPHSELKTKDAKGDNIKFGLPIIIADLHLSDGASKHICHESLNTYVGPLGFLLVVPLPCPKDDPDAGPIYRVSCPPEKSNETITQEYLQKVIDTALGLKEKKGQKVTVTKVLWTSRFRVRSAVAETFYKPMGGGTIVLAGDAAHVHSPAGGQGMNLGIRDAIELGSILSSIIKYEQSSASPDAIKAFSESALKKFSDDRRELATKVIKMTKVMTWATGLKSTPARKTRNTVWRLMGKTSVVPNRVALSLSGLAS
ncbi:hypothetical protein B0H34DRAFT_802969 [Crassisporium funariophilum]|nr:hypothetical protein B0H34DRAFT_802969 [Crassisporium funariophilum]